MGVDVNSEDHFKRNDYFDECLEGLFLWHFVLSGSDWDSDGLASLPSDSSVVVLGWDNKGCFLGAHFVNISLSPMPAVVHADAAQEWEQEVTKLRTKSVQKRFAKFKVWVSIFSRPRGRMTLIYIKQR